MGGERSDLPPRLRNWKEGQPQIGAFLRTRKGSTITLVKDAASYDQETLLFALILGTWRIPVEVMAGLTAWVNSQVKDRSA